MDKVITQKFTSIHQIDKEFIPSLEELLAEQIPNFEYIENSEKMADENTKFNYYLFFGNQTNAPIGFAQVNIIKDSPQKPNLLKKILNRKIINREVNENSAYWQIAGTLHGGIVFNPKYSQHIANKTREVFDEIFQREDIHFQKMNFSEDYQIHLNQVPLQGVSEPVETQVIDSLLKNKSSYQEYLYSLPDVTRVNIMKTWKFVQKELSYKMGEYSHFKTVFEYKERGKEQLKELKKIIEQKKINITIENISFHTFETQYEIKSLAVLIRGNGGHYYYDVISLDESLPEMIPHQQIILQFYEFEDASRLHYLGEDLLVDYFTDLGFTLKKNFSISINKNE